MNGEEAEVHPPCAVQGKSPHVEAIEKICAAAKETRAPGDETAGGS